MGNFWANRVLPQQQAPQQYQPAPAPADNPWWAIRRDPRPVQQQPLPPIQSQQVVTNENGEVPIGELLHQEGYQYTSDKAQSARDPQRCPECDGPNYVADKTDVRSMKHCFDCGYNPRFTQSMAGLSATGQKNVEAPRPARVQALTQGNYNPQVIVGRVA